MLDEIISVIAPTLNCIQLLPQLCKTYSTKQVNDISIESLILIITTNILWFLYGIFIYNMPLIISGCVSLFINCALMVLYMNYK